MSQGLALLIENKAFLNPSCILSSIPATHRTKAVLIATPPESHLDLAKLSIYYNRHVWIEKPICQSYEETLELEFFIKFNVSNFSMVSNSVTLIFCFFASISFIIFEIL